MNPFHLKLGKLKVSQVCFCAASSEQAWSKPAPRVGLSVGHPGMSQSEGKGNETGLKEMGMNSLYLWEKGAGGAGVR